MILGLKMDIVRMVVFMAILLTYQNSYGKTISYADIEDYIGPNHPLLQAEGKKITAATEKRQFVEVQNTMPEIRLYGGYEAYSSPVLPDDRSPYLVGEASVNLYRGGKDSLLVENGRIVEEMAGLSLRLKQDHLVLKASQVYWKLLAFEKEVKSIDTAHTKLRRMRTNIQKKIKSGIAPRTDLIFLKIKDQELTSEKQAKLRDLEGLKNYLVFLLGLEKDSDPITIAFSDVSPNPQFQQTRGAEKKQFEEIQIIKSKIAAARVEKNLLEASLLPEIDLYGSYGQRSYQSRELTEPTDRIETIIGIRFSVPLSQHLIRGRNISLIDSSVNILESEIQEIKARITFRESFIHKDIGNKAKTLQETRALLLDMQSLISESGQEYELGVRNAVELIDLYQQALETENKSTRLQLEIHLLHECLKHIEVFECVALDFSQR